MKVKLCGVPMCIAELAVLGQEHKVLELRAKC